MPFINCIVESKLISKEEIDAMKKRVKSYMDKTDKEIITEEFEKKIKGFTDNGDSPIVAEAKVKHEFINDQYSKLNKELNEIKSKLGGKAKEVKSFVTPDFKDINKKYEADKQAEKNKTVTPVVDNVVKQDRETVSGGKESDIGLIKDMSIERQKEAYKNAIDSGDYPNVPFKEFIDDMQKNFDWNVKENRPTDDRDYLKKESKTPIKKDNVGVDKGVTDSEIKIAQSKYDAAKRELNKKENEITKTQNEQQSIFGGEQKGMFAMGREEAKSKTPITETTNNTTETKTEDQPSKIDEPPISEPPQVTENNNGDNLNQWTRVNRSSLSKVKDLFRKVGISWSDRADAAMENLAARSREGETLVNTATREMDGFHADLVNKKPLRFNTEDQVAMHFLKISTEQEAAKLSETAQANEDFTSINSIGAEVLTNQLDRVNAVLGAMRSESGVSLGYGTVEARLHPDYGLQVRQMEMIRANGGNPLSEEVNGFLKDQWAKEKEIMQRESELQKEGMKEDFDKQIAELHKEYEAKIKDLSKNKTAPTKEKTSNKLRDIAKSIRTSNEFDKFLKSSKGDIQQAGISIDFKELAAQAVEHVANLLDKGEKIGDAIKTAAGKFKGDLEESDFAKILTSIYDNSKLPDREKALGKIKDLADENKDTEITNDMVSKNLIRDYVESHIGEVSQENILNEATKGLKEVLPDITKEKVIEAYLKEGEFKQPTKKELEGGIAQAKKQLTSIAKLTEDIEDLNNLKEVRKRSFPNERAKSQYEQKLYDEKTAKLQELAKKRKTERDNQNRKDKIDELDANIKRAAADRDLIKTHRNKTAKEIDEEIAAKQKELKKVIKSNTSDERLQAQKLASEKEKAIKNKAEFQRKLDAGEYQTKAQERTRTILNKADAGLIQLNRQTAKIESDYRKKQNEVQDKQKHWGEKLADTLRGLWVAYLIVHPKTFAKIAWMSLIRPTSEIMSKLTFGKAFELIDPTISNRAKGGGESNSIMTVQKMAAAYFNQLGAKGLQAKYEAGEKSFLDAQRKYEDYKNSPNPAKEKLQSLKRDMSNKQLSSIGNMMYQFIGGSSVKDAWEALLRRSNNIEKQFGHIGTENFKEGSKWDKFNYIIGFVGRSHSAAKTFSGRASFAAGFMARVEHAISNGEDLHANKLLEIGHESYLDWERGKYQQSNWVSDKWNDAVNGLGNKIGKPQSEARNTYDKVAQKLLKTEVAITRVPVNIIHEEVAEYLLGAFRAPYYAFKEYKKAGGQARNEGFTKDVVDSDGLSKGEMGKQFKERVKEIVSEMDEKQAAKIVRCFRKGGLGLGLYATAAILGGIQFGIFPHMGQKKKKDEEKLKPNELNPGQVMIGKDKLGETVSGMIEHTPALWDLFMGLGIAKIYHDDVNGIGHKKKYSTIKAAGDALITHLEIIEGNIPQTKLISPTALFKGIVKSGIKTGANVKENFKSVEDNLKSWGLFDNSKK